MQSELHSLSKIFSEIILRIPDYQRGYSWEEKHLREFWNDLLQLPQKKSHYTGVLTLEPVKSEQFEKWEDDRWIIESKSYKPLYIVDGQQRLTTAIILIQCLIETLAAEEDELNYSTKAEIRKKFIFETRDRGQSRSYIFGYEKDNPSYEFLKRNIFNEQSENHSVIETTIYTSNLSAAKTFFAERLKALKEEEISELYIKLTQHMQFNIFYIEPELDVFVTFETMNNRGKPLSNLELLKNRLIYLSTKFDEDRVEQERLRKKINESWKTVYHYLGKRTSHALDDDAFLFVHFLAYFGQDLPKEEDEESDGTKNYKIFRHYMREESFKAELLERIFTSRRLKVPAGEAPLSSSEVDDYAHDIKSSVETYFYISEPDSSDYSDNEKLLLQQLARVPRGDSRLLILVLFQTTKDPEIRTRLLVSLERYGFLASLKPYFFRQYDLEQLAIKLKAGDLSVDEINRKLDTISAEFAGSNELSDLLKSIGKNNGYYGWVGLQYFLFEYEQHLRAQSKSVRQLLSWETFQQESFEEDHKTIEHILPQRITDPYWKTEFSKYSIAERNFLKNSLGNLLPVSSPKNSSLSNKSFLAKCGSASNQVGYRYGCLSEIQVACQSRWDATAIAIRGINLLNFMEERWGLKLGDSERKLELLGLKFVANREGKSAQGLIDDYLSCQSNS
jgi:hypothetical protein